MDRLLNHDCLAAILLEARTLSLSALVCRTFHTIVTTHGSLCARRMVMLRGLHPDSVVPAWSKHLYAPQHGGILLPEAIHAKLFERAPRLLSINLRNCRRLRVLPEELPEATMRSLETVWIGSPLHWDPSMLRVLPPWVGGPMPSLRVLNLEGCIAIQHLPALRSLPMLEDLRLGWCTNLLELPADLGEHLPRLQMLRLWRCTNLRCLPDSLGGLTRLQELDMAQCTSVERLPDSFVGLRELEVLNVSFCEAITEMPPGFETLPRIRHISAMRCPWFCVRTAMRLPRLQTLRLGDYGGSECVKLPQDPFDACPTLWHLDLFSCNLVEMPSYGLAARLQGLTTLSLAECMYLRRLPEDLGELKQLRSLNIAQCVNLECLPANITQLSNLTSLDMSGLVLIEELPFFPLMVKLNLTGCIGMPIELTITNTICRMRYLERLDLSEWELEELPANFGDCVPLLTELCLYQCEFLLSLRGLEPLEHKLQSLDLSCCKSLAVLPEWLGLSECIKHIDITDCPGAMDFEMRYRELLTMRGCVMY
jgi:hypothetical protein